MRAQLLASTLLLLPASPCLAVREPLDASEIETLAASRDVFRVSELEAIFDGRWVRLSRFPPSLPPPELEREVVASLDALSRLDPAAGARRAQVVLSRETSEAVRRAARRTLAATGTLEVVRRELLHFFDDPRGAKESLGTAAATTGDLRLRDFAEPGDWPEPSPRSRIERRLARATEPRAVRALLAAGAPARVLGALPAGPLDDRVERALKRSLASSSEREVLDAIEALAFRRELDPDALRALLDDGRVAVRALAARYGNDVEAIRARLEEDAREPFFAEAVRSVARLEGAEGARELAPRVRGRGFRATLALLDALGPGDVPLARELVLALAGADRARLLRVLAEEDRPVLTTVPLGAEDVDALYAYLALSRHRGLRELLPLAERARGEALASGLLSSKTTLDEKRDLLSRMEDAWGAAIAAGGPALADCFETLVGEDAVERFVADSAVDDDFLAALALLPTSRARLRLQAIASEAAISALLARPDRILALPALTRLASRGSEAAKLAVLRLGGAGASAFLRAELAWGADAALLAAVSRSPLDPQSVQAAIEPSARRAEPSPEALAALFQFHERYPADFLALASEETGPLADRVSFVLSLSDETDRLPLLIDRAVGFSDRASQEAALLGLAERELGAFDQRLHRLAGDRDRRVRFLAAAALVPSGEPWALRLLVAELDAEDRFERRRASLALARLGADRARATLERMIEDGTASPFAIDALVDRSSDAREDLGLQRRAFELLEDAVDRGELPALLAASRLAEPAAVAAVVRWLREP